MELMTSWDDGYIADTQIARLLTKYKLPGRFFIPNNCRLLPGYIHSLHTQGFTIGGHTVSHPEDLKWLIRENLIREIVDNKKWLEEIIDAPIKHFCYPSGRYGLREIEEVKNAGYETARTTLVGNIVKQVNPYKDHPTVHVRPDRKEYEGVYWLDYAKERFMAAKATGGAYFHVWGHSWEVSQFGLWEELEELFKFINENK